MITTGSVLKRHMENLNFTQAHISRESGIPKNALNEMLNGKRAISVLNLLKICKAANISAGDIINEVNDEYQQSHFN